MQSGQWGEAVAAFSKALELQPNSAQAQNHLAWLLATCTDARLRDPRRAVALARKGVEIAPGDGMIWNTLGVAHYRAGDWDTAVAALEKSNDLLGGKELGFNAFFLAMAHWQRGDKPHACSWYDRAVCWMEKNRPKEEELLRFRAEAAAMLGVKKTKN